MKKLTILFVTAILFFAGCDCGCDEAAKTQLLKKLPKNTILLKDLGKRWYLVGIDGKTYIVSYLDNTVGNLTLYSDKILLPNLED